MAAGADGASGSGPGVSMLGPSSVSVLAGPPPGAALGAGRGAFHPGVEGGLASRVCKGLQKWALKSQEV